MSAPAAGPGSAVFGLLVSILVIRTPRTEPAVTTEIESASNPTRCPRHATAGTV